MGSGSEETGARRPEGLVKEAADAWFADPPVVSFPAKWVEVLEGEELEARFFPRRPPDILGEVYRNYGVDGWLRLTLTREWAEQHFPPDGARYAGFGEWEARLPWGPGAYLRIDPDSGPFRQPLQDRERVARLCRNGSESVLCLGERHEVIWSRGKPSFRNHAPKELLMLEQLGEQGCAEILRRSMAETRALRKYLRRPARQLGGLPGAATGLFASAMRKVKLEADIYWSSGMIMVDPSATKAGGTFYIRVGLAIPGIEWVKGVYLEGKAVQDGALNLGHHVWLGEERIHSLRALLARPGRTRAEWLLEIERASLAELARRLLRKKR